MKSKEISFYRLTTLPIEKAAPKLIEKIYYTKQRLIVIAENEHLMTKLDEGLWVYSTKHFIPHGTYRDDYQNEQPVYLTTSLENPNGATIAMALGKIDLDGFIADKYFYMFDGNDPEQVTFGRKQWQLHKQQQHILTYWQQNLSGGWEKQD